jgi:hypothetical protein
MEEVMSSSKIILQTVTATAIFAAFAINAAHAANNASVRAVAKQNGHAQYAQAQRFAARRAIPGQDQWAGWGSWEPSSQYHQATRFAARRAVPSQEQWGVTVTFGPSSSSSSTANLDDQVRQIDEMNRMQDMLNQQTINQDIQQDNAAAAVAAQWQNDLINATAPVGPQ